MSDSSFKPKQGECRVCHKPLKSSTPGAGWICIKCKRELSKKIMAERRIRDRTKKSVAVTDKHIAEWNKMHPICIQIPTVEEMAGACKPTGFSIGSGAKMNRNELI